MGMGSFLTGLALGSSVTAVLLYYAFLRGVDDGADEDDGLDGYDDYDDDDDDDDVVDGNKYGHSFLQVQKRHLRSLKAALGRKNPETSFFTYVIAELWSHIRIAAADKVQSQVEPYFKNMPSPMNTCRFVKVDLGNTPMAMNNIVVHPIQNDAVQWDFNMEWDGDCDIQLQADYIGTFGVKKLKMFGRMAIIFKPLTNELPVVSCIQYSFINMPHIDLQFTGLASVAELSVLNDAIKGAIQGAMMTSCLPHRRLYKLSADNNYFDTYVPPVGILRLTIEGGRGFVIEKRLLSKDDIPDVFLNVSVGATIKGSPGVWRTKTIVDDCNPRWNATKDFLLWDRFQEVLVHAWDEDKGPLDPDDELGMASVTVTELLLSPHRRKDLPLLMKGRKTGAFVTLSCLIGEWTIDLDSLSATVENGVAKEIEPSTISGLLVIVINRAFRLPLDRRTAMTFVKVKFAGKEYDSNVIYDFPGYYDALNPAYESAFTIPLSSNMNIVDDTMVELSLIDAGQDDKSNIVGSTSVIIRDLKNHPNNTLTEKRTLSGDGNVGEALEFRVSLSGVCVPRHQPSSFTGIDAALNGLAPGASSPTKSRLFSNSDLTSSKSISMDEDDIVGALGTVRITVVEGRGLKIEQQLFEVSIPDCYCIVKFGSRKLKTTIKHNTITPRWEEHKDFALDNHGELIKVEVWDMNEEVRGNGILLGETTTTAGKLVITGGPTELELQKDGRNSGIFITLNGEMIV